MIDAALVDQIRQKRFDNLATKHLHVARRQRLNRWSEVVDYLAVAVPIVYFVFRYLAKGTPSEYWVETAWEVLAVLLIALALVKITFRWQAVAQQHSANMGENIALVRQADNILGDTAQASIDAARLFLVLADKSETDDRNLLGEPKPAARRHAYLEALKEMDSPCPKCHTSPWSFLAGSCQLCGNTPKGK